MKNKPKPRIALLREKAGLTQLQLSRLVGVTESTIQNWESGRTGTDHIERIIRFCKALNCQVDDLIEYMGDASENSLTEPGSLNEIHHLLGTEKLATDPRADSEVSQPREAKSS
ncbi:MULTISPECIES: helix-turn-helix transcriptional regulator [unclassified Anabaena]|uniref:helix-turn-helix transcriptional regulator n=1 Tax=unclassified Anabaena TaxID=2619674 RepID=UPI0039C66FFB